MKLIEVEQGTDAWRLARCGKVTASRINDVMAKVKSGEAASRRDYKAQLVAEILTGRPQDDGYISSAMTHGTENEPFARAAYEIATGAMVDQCGLVLHPTIERGAASPDGLVGTFSLVEIKCPKTSTHLQYLLDGNVPSQYQNQMLWQMACTERGSCDFVSFDPRLTDNLQLFVVPFKRDENRIMEIEAEVRKFLDEVDAIIDRISNRAA